MRIKFLPTKETLFPVEMGITRGHMANGTIESEEDAFECNFRAKTTSERLYDSVVGRSKIKLFAIGKKTWKSAANELCCDLGYFRQSSNLSIDLNRVSTSAVSSVVSFEPLRRTSFDDRTAQANGTVLKTEDDDEARRKKKTGTKTKFPFGRHDRRWLFFLFASVIIRRSNGCIWTTRSLSIRGIFSCSIIPR